MFEWQHMHVLVEACVYWGMHESVSGLSWFTSEINPIIDVAKFMTLATFFMLIPESGFNPAWEQIYWTT